MDLMSNELVSLDTLVIPTDTLRYKLPADCVLLTGTIIVDESMLTGSTSLVSVLFSTSKFTFPYFQIGNT